MFQGFFAKVGFGAMNCWKNGASLKGVLAHPLEFLGAAQALIISV